MLEKNKYNLEFQTYCFLMHTLIEKMNNPLSGNSPKQITEHQFNIFLDILESDNQDLKLGWMESQNKSIYVALVYESLVEINSTSQSIQDYTKILKYLKYLKEFYVEGTIPYFRTLNSIAHFLPYAMAGNPDHIKEKTEEIYNDLTSKEVKKVDKASWAIYASNYAVFKLRNLRIEVAIKEIINETHGKEISDIENLLRKSINIKKSMNDVDNICYSIINLIDLYRISLDSENCKLWTLKLRDYLPEIEDSSLKSASLVRVCRFTDFSESDFYNQILEIKTDIIELSSMLELELIKFSYKNRGKKRDTVFYEQKICLLKNIFHEHLISEYIKILSEDAKLLINNDEINIAIHVYEYMFFLVENQYLKFLFSPVTLHSALRDLNISLRNYCYCLCKVGRSLDAVVALEKFGGLELSKIEKSSVAALSKAKDKNKVEEYKKLINIAYSKNINPQLHPGNIHRKLKEIELSLYSGTNYDSLQIDDKQLRKIKIKPTIYIFNIPLCTVIINVYSSLFGKLRSESHFIDITGETLSNLLYGDFQPDKNSPGLLTLTMINTENYPGDYIQDLEASLERLCQLHTLGDKLRELLKKHKNQLDIITFGYYSSFPLHIIQTSEKIFLDDLGILIPKYTIRQCYRKNKKSTERGLLLAPASDLRYAQDELISTAEFFKKKKLDYKIINSFIDRESIIEEIENRSLIHFIGHSTNNLVNNFYQSYGNSINFGEYSLQYSDFSNINLTRKKIFLSACTSAGTSQNNLDEKLGLNYILLSMGCDLVISSYWPVDDYATSFLFSKFYEDWSMEKTEVPYQLQSVRKLLRNNNNFSKIQNWASFDCFTR